MRAGFCARRTVDSGQAVGLFMNRPALVGVIVEVLSGGAPALVHAAIADEAVGPRVDAHPLRLHALGASDPHVLAAA